MNDLNISSKNSSARRTYHRRNRKGNRTNTSLPIYFPLTTPIITLNTTLLINSSSVPITDLFVPVSFFTQYKYWFITGLSFLILLCVLSIVFFVVIFKCRKSEKWKNHRQNRLDKKRLKTLPDFLDDQHGHKDENDILLEPNGGTNSLINNNNNAITTNGLIPSDNISNTFSIDPMLEQKIARNNPPNAIPLSPTADDTSLDTLRGSLISSPSQQISIHQRPSTPTYSTARTPSVPIPPSTTTDSHTNPDEHAVEAEKDDDLHDLDLKPIQQRYIKATNNSSSNLPAHRSSASNIEQTIRKQEQKAEREERNLLHGSNSNLYEKELRKLAEKEASSRKQHTNSQVSLVSRTSEDSCY